MKKLVIAILCGLFLFVSCTGDKAEKAPKELKVIATYVYNGQVYNQFGGFPGLYPDFSQTPEGERPYSGLQNSIIIYTNQWVEMLKVRDAEIEALENENKAMREYVEAITSYKIK